MTEETPQVPGSAAPSASLPSGAGASGPATSEPTAPADRGLRWLIGPALAIMLVLVVRAFLVAPFSIPSGSMEDTLDVGDRLLVTRTTDPEELQRGDLVVFDASRAFNLEVPDKGLLESVAEAIGGLVGQGAPTDYVKRVIGLPGDRIAIQGGTSPVVYLRPAGSRTTYRVDNPTWGPQIGSATSSCCGDQVTSVTGDGAMRWATVPAGSYFVMGDNWGGSTDSRVFGPIPASGIKAKLSLRIMPLGRFGGIGHGVRLVAQRD